MFVSQEELFTSIASEKNCNYSDALSKKLIEMIITGKLHTGYVFPNENMLCRQLDIGRSTLREAYKVLDSLGYIIRTKAGTKVNSIENTAVNGLFKATLGLSEYNDLIEFMLINEPKAVMLAADRITDDELNVIESYMVNCELNWVKMDLLEYYNKEFHMKIRTACKNQILISALCACNDTHDRQVLKRIYVKENKDNGFLKDSLKEHRVLFNALRQRDTEYAYNITVQHLRSTFQRADSIANKY